MTNFLFITTDYSSVTEQLIKFIRDFASEKKIVMGLSGGIDSSVSCALAAKAIGPENVKAVIINNTQFTKEGIEIANAYARSLGVEVQQVDSEGLRENIIQNLALTDANAILNATIDVRMCDLIIRTIAQVDNRLYMGTINGTERLVGWYPKGALVGDFCPIGGLLKHQIKGIARYLKLDELAEGVSQDASIVCGGCGELPEFKGISYEQLDSVLLAEEIIRKNGISKEQQNTITQRMHATWHKQDIFPKYCEIK